MRRFLPLAVGAACCALVASIGVAWAATTSTGHAYDGSETRALTLYPHGPAESCGGGSCGVRAVTPSTFRLPASAHLYSGTITVSFTYRTRGSGSFFLGARVTQAGTFRNVGTILPARRPLAPAARPSGQTFVLRVLRLPGGRPLQLTPVATGGSRRASPASFSTSAVVVELRVATS